MTTSATLTIMIIFRRGGCNADGDADIYDGQERKVPDEDEDSDEDEIGTIRSDANEEETV